MKNNIYLLSFTILLSIGCAKEETTSSDPPLVPTDLQEIILGGNESATWQVQHMTFQHREGFILNGVKTYTFISDTITSIDVSANMTFTFYDQGDSVSISPPDDLDVVTALQFGQHFEGGIITYEFPNDNKIEFFGPYIDWLDAQIYTQWDITSSNSKSISAIYDDFWPEDNPAPTDTVWFGCDQGELVINKIN